MDYSSYYLLYGCLRCLIVILRLTIVTSSLSDSSRLDLLSLILLYLSSMLYNIYDGIVMGNILRMNLTMLLSNDLS